MLLARLGDLVSDEHSVGGTLLEVWASHKSFRPKDDYDGEDGGNFRGLPRINEMRAPPPRIQMPA